MESAAFRARVTRADVARLAGVSPSVVSYVINQGPRPVSAPVRRRVEEAIAALNYKPNETARALVRGRTQHVGLVAVDITSPFYSDLSGAIDHELFMRGLTLVTASSTYRQSDGRESPLELLTAHNVTAALVSTSVRPADIDFARTHDLPIVALNEQQSTEGLSATIVDYYGGTETAVRHLIGHGRHHIGFVGDTSSTDQRYSGWRHAVESAGLSPGPAVMCGWTAEEGYRAGQWLVKQGFRIHELDALFIASDAVAMGCLAALRDGGIDVPDDLAIVSFDGTKLSRYLSPGLTTMAQPIEQLAADAVRLLLDSVSGEAMQLHYKPELITRRSCGCTGELDQEIHKAQPSGHGGD